MVKQYKIKVIKESILEAETDYEAEQIAEILTQREGISKAFGNTMFVYSDVEPVSV